MGWVGLEEGCVCARISYAVHAVFAHNVFRALNPAHSMLKGSQEREIQTAGAVVTAQSERRLLDNFLLLFIRRSAWSDCNGAEKVWSCISHIRQDDLDPASSETRVDAQRKMLN